MVALFSTLALTLFALIFCFYPYIRPSPYTTPYVNGRKHAMYPAGCDIFRGEWVPDPNAPYYTNETCQVIHDKQNCMKHGRPDSEYLKWRWKPDECELPVFNPAQFLEIVRGKSLAFVGDSLGRNHMQALICQLLRVTYVKDVSPTIDYKSRTWLFPTYNFIVANFWSPFLVNTKEAESDGEPLTGYSLYLDEPDKNWTAHIMEFDYVIISVGHWFFRPLMYYENNELVGCYHCEQENVTDLTVYYGFARAFRTSFKALYTLDGFNGMTFLRTFSPDHFENGEWNKGGDCTRTKPFKRNETTFNGLVSELYMTQVEEFRAAESEARKRGLKFRLLNTTDAMLLRPDGHPSRYGHWPNENVSLVIDCVHWCLPGPVDVWNDFLLQILMMEDQQSFFFIMNTK